MKINEKENVAKNKPTILVVTGGYFPGKEYGGVATSRGNFAQALGDEFDIAIVTKDHDYKTPGRYKDIKDGWNVMGKARVWYCSDDQFNYQTFKKLMQETKPIILYASGTITSYFSHNKYAFKAAKELGVPILLTPDGDVCTNAMRTKRLKKIVATILCRITGAFKNVWFQPTATEEVKNLPKYLNVPKDRITLLANLPYIFPARKSYLKEQGKLKVVFSGRIHPIKNLKYVIEVLSNVKTNVIMDIYGPLEITEYWQECKDLIEKLPKNVKVVYKGRVDPDKAKQIAMDYDCYFLPTLSENYGYTIEEALLCGCPAIISKGTTPWDDLDGKAGFVGSLDDKQAFIDEIEKLANMDNDEYASYCSNIANYLENKLSYKKLCEDYKNLIYKVAESKR